MSDPSPGEMEVQPPRRAFWRNLSPIWIVPILALAVAIGVAWRSYSDRGALIEISFQNAAGIAPGETSIRFRDVVIGTVEKVAFTSDLSSVIVSARISDVVAQTLPVSAQFWVVRPEVSARGISGLSTVLSGVYIQAIWNPTEGAGATGFTGLEAPPLVESGRAGALVTIRAADGNMLSGGAPVFYRGIEVGKIEQPELTEGGTGVTVNAFIDAPNDKRLTTATRFWDMSGFSISLGAQGLALNVGSLAALVGGGLAFDNVFSGGEPVPKDFVFDLYPDEASARDSVFSQVGVNAVKLAIDFEGSVNGLTSGAAVQFRGIKVGQVDSIAAFVVPSGDRQTVRLRAVVSIDPQAMGLPKDAGSGALLQFLKQAVADGLRAQLTTQNLFSSALMIRLDDVPDAAPAALLVPEDGLPVLPSVTSELPDVTATAEGVLKRINALPVEALMNQAITLMASIQAIAEDDGTRKVPGEAAALIADARGLIGSADTQAVPGELRAAISDLGGIIADLRKQDTAARLSTALDSATKALDGVNIATQGVPELVAQLRRLSEKVNALDAEGLVAAGQQVLNDADALIGTDQARAIPPAVAEAVGQVRDLVTELRQQGISRRLAAALDNAATAAAAVSGATDGVPELVASLTALSDQAGALDAEGLVTAAQQVLKDADALIGTDQAKAIPPALAEALGQVRDLVTELRQQGTAERLAAALDAAATAATDVSGATDGVPELVASLKSVADKANALDAEGLVASARTVLDNANALVGTDAARLIPPALAQALGQIRDLAADLQQKGAVDRLITALDNASIAATDVSAATDGVPELVQSLQVTAANAEKVDAAGLADAARKVLDSADRLIGTDAAQAVPPALSAALEQVRGALADLRAGGVIENANATFASARDAADAVAAAAKSLPDLAARLDRVATKAEALVSAYGDRSDFNQQTLDMLREVSTAARNVGQLARDIQRNPNSLLLGR